MKIAILFWFYKEVEICKNRLELIKKNNPDAQIYGLYGGSSKESDLFKTELSPYLDDFYQHPNTDADWKWIHGDLMILDWYQHRGKELDWDSIAVIQWDMLVFDSIKKIVPNIKKDQIVLSGFRKLSDKIENSWDWTRKDSKERKNYLSFLEHIKENYHYVSRPYCCLFIFEIFPKVFFEKYSKVKNVEIGMLEYKVPTYAKIFNLDIVDIDIGVYWYGNWKEYPLNAMPYEIEKEYIQNELHKEDGWRLFHPHFDIWK